MIPDFLCYGRKSACRCGSRTWKENRPCVLCSGDGCDDCRELRNGEPVCGECARDLEETEAA